MDCNCELIKWKKAFIKFKLINDNEKYETSLKHSSTEPLKSIEISFKSNCARHNDSSILHAFQAAFPNMNLLTSLSLEGCQLTEVPPTFSLLRLKSFNISHNLLMKVPSCIFSGLMYLEELDLSFNKLDNFYCHPKCSNYLRQLNISYCKFTDLPRWLSDCPNFEELIYDGNKVKMDNYCIYFKKFSFSNGNANNFYSSIRQACNLTYLDVGDTQGFDLNFLMNEATYWSQIEVLHLNKLEIRQLPVHVCDLHALKVLYLADNSLSRLPNELHFLTDLEELDVSNNLLIELILNNGKLRKLKASNNFIGSIEIDMSSLLYLDLYNNCLAEISFDGTRIDSLDIDKNYIDSERLPSNYTDKQANLRQNLSHRFNGCRDMPNESADSSHSSVTYYSDGSLHSVSSDCEEWVLNKTEGVTTSDDEYRGEIRQARPLTRRSCRLNDAIYSDVD